MNWNNCNPPSSVKELDPDFALQLHFLEVDCGFEFKINSAFRTVEHEKRKGRPGTSSHCKGLAVDISCVDSNRRYLLVAYAINRGFKRIGIYKHFIHLDCDCDKNAPVIWYG